MIKRKIHVSLIKIILLILIVLSVFSILLTFSCAQPEPVNNVRIGYLLGDIHHLPLAVAFEKGFFKDAGINVEEVGPFDAGPALMDHLAANEIDMGYVGISPVILSAARKTEVTIVAGVNLEGSALITEKSITNVSDLKSKKIAVPASGSIQHILMGMLLSQNNMSSKDIEVLAGTIKVDHMLESLKSGSIDGYFVWEPFVASSVISGAGTVLVDSKDIWPNHPCCVIVTRNDFLKNNDKVVNAVVKAHLRAIDFIAENPTEAKIIAQEYTGLAPDVIDIAFKRIKYVASVDNDSIEKIVREIIALGESDVIEPIISSTDIPDVDTFVNKIVYLGYLTR
jgi:NitT/TauT family transport system substrate-binding protein